MIFKKDSQRERLKAVRRVQVPHTHKGIILTIKQKIMKTIKAMSANEITEKCINLGVKNEITDERFNKVLEIQKKYLHNIAVYFDGGKFPSAPMYTREQAKIKVPFEVYTGKMQAKKEKLKSLKRYLQEYYDNASFGLPETRRRNMILLRWDIRKLERELQNA